MRILLTGATGYVGGRLAPRLIAEGHELRCLARDPARLAGRPWGAHEVVAGDVSDLESLRRALDGCDAAYYLVHSMTAGEKGFEDRDRACARIFADAVKSTPSLRRIIYLGGLGGADRGLSSHLESRQEVGEILRGGGVPVTEFRAAVVVGSGSASFEMIRCLTERVPVMICPRWVSTRCQPIAIRDVLRYLIDALSVGESAGRVLEIGGTDVLTYRQMMEQYAEVRKLRRWIINVPVLTPRLSSYWVDLVTPIPAGAGAAADRGAQVGGSGARRHGADGCFRSSPWATGAPWNWRSSAARAATSSRAGSTPTAFARRPARTTSSASTRG